MFKTLRALINLILYYRQYGYMVALLLTSILTVITVQKKYAGLQL